MTRETNTHKHTHTNTHKHKSKSVWPKSVWPKSDWPKSVWPKSVLAKVGLAKVGHDLMATIGQRARFLEFWGGVVLLWSRQQHGSAAKEGRV